MPEIIWLSEFLIVQSSNGINDSVDDDTFFIPPFVIDNNKYYSPRQLRREFKTAGRSSFADYLAWFVTILRWLAVVQRRINPFDPILASPRVRCPQPPREVHTANTNSPDDELERTVLRRDDLPPISCELPVSLECPSNTQHSSYTSQPIKTANTGDAQPARRFLKSRAVHSR